MYLRSGQASQQVPGWRLVLARLCLAGAVVISMYLSWSSLRSQAVAGCGAEGGCEGVLASRWSEVAGMPVGLIGALLYSVLLLGTLLPRPRTMANFVHAAASLLVIFGALWFVALQLFVVKQFCPWCCATHALAVLGVAFAWRKGEVWRGDVVGYPRVFLPLGLALTMAVLQSMSRPKERIVQSELETGAVSRDEETLYLYGGKVRLKLDQLPSRGRAEAPVIAVLLSDFTCPHCLELQRRLRDYEEETGGADLRVLHLPGYQEPLAREIHRLLLVAWRVDPALYQEATGAILSGELPVVYAEIEDFLKAKYAGDWSLEMVAQVDWASNVLEQGETLRELNVAASGEESLPQLLIGRQILVGNPAIETLRNVVARTQAAPSGRPDLSLDEAPAGMATARELGLDFDEELQDLGRIPQGEKKTVSYRFRNTGDEAVTIEQLNTSCGCAKGEGWRQTVEPGEMGSFDIQLNTNELVGPVRKVISLRTNRSEKRCQVFFEAEVWTPVRVLPRMMRFGTLLQGSEEVERSVDLVVMEDNVPPLEELEMEGEGFQARLEPLAEGRQYRLIATLKPEELGRLSGSLRVPLDFPGFQSVEVPISAEVVRPVEVHPPVIEGDQNSGGRSLSLNVICHDREREDFALEETAYLGSQAVEIKQEEPRGSSVRVVVSFAEDFDFNLAEESGAVLHLRTNQDDFRDLYLPLRWRE